MTDEKEQAITLGPATVVRAFRPGDVVFIETSQRYTQEMLGRFREFFSVVHEQHGIRIILLDCGMKVAAAQITEGVQS